MKVFIIKWFGFDGEAVTHPLVQFMPKYRYMCCKENALVKVKVLIQLLYWSKSEKVKSLYLHTWTENWIQSGFNVADGSCSAIWEETNKLEKCHINSYFWVKVDILCVQAVISWHVLVLLLWGLLLIVDLHSSIHQNMDRCYTSSIMADFQHLDSAKVQSEWI